MTDDAALTKAEIQEAADEFRGAHIGGNMFVLSNENGQQEIVEINDDTGRLIVHADLTPNQDANVAEYNAHSGFKLSQEFRRYASLPIAFLMKYGFDNKLPSGWYWKKEYLPLLERIAHDPQYRQFRTAPGNFIRRGNS